MKINQKCIIESIENLDFKLKVRLMELGLVRGTNLYVKNKSILKKTLLIVFASSCFSLSTKIADNIMVR
ncbi:MAG: ferrous iron transport protein A, partial [Clostridia bacterium]|nr:ferrous iron transport protein A [Clostridia bacterium]